MIKLLYQYNQSINYVKLQWNYSISAHFSVINPKPIILPLQQLYSAVIIYISLLGMHPGDIINNHFSHKTWVLTVFVEPKQNSYTKNEIK